MGFKRALATRDNDGGNRGEKNPQETSTASLGQLYVFFFFSFHFLITNIILGTVLDNYTRLPLPRCKREPEGFFPYPTQLLPTYLHMTMVRNIDDDGGMRRTRENGSSISIFFVSFFIITYCNSNYCDNRLLPVDSCAIAPSTVREVEMRSSKARHKRKREAGTSRTTDETSLAGMEK